MTWLPFIAFGLFFANINFIYFYTQQFGWITLLFIIIICLLVGIFIVKQKKLSTLLELNSEINQNNFDEKLIKDVSYIFMAVLIAFPGIMTALIGMLLFLPRWRKKITLWLMPLLHL